MLHSDSAMSDRLEDVSPAQITRRLTRFVLLVLAFECASIAVAPRLHSGSVLKIAKDCLLLRVRNDSWYSMAHADQAWRQHPNAIYETVFFQRGVRFIYPPISLLLYRLWRSARWIGIQPFRAMNGTLLACLLGTLIVAGEFFLRLLPDKTRAVTSRMERWSVRSAIALLGLVFLPIINAYFLGQVQTLLTFLLVASAFLWLRGGRTAPAVMIGVTCWLKPQMALFLVWGLLRRQWSFAVSFCITLMVGLAISLAVFGWHNTVEYSCVLRYLSRHGDALATNQSLNGMLHRVLHVGSPVTWVYGYPPYNRTIYFSTLFSSAVIVALALIVPALRGIAASTTDFLIFAMATTMASPIAWEHHYGFFILVFLLWMPEAFQRWKTFAALVGIYILMTDTWAPLTPLMYTRWSFLISHVYFGGLILFVWTLFAAKFESSTSKERALTGH